MTFHYSRRQGSGRPTTFRNFEEIQIHGVLPPSAEAGPQRASEKAVSPQGIDNSHPCRAALASVPAALPLLRQTRQGVTRRSFNLDMTSLMLALVEHENSLAAQLGAPCDSSHLQASTPSLPTTPPDAHNAPPCVEGPQATPPVGTPPQPVLAASPAPVAASARPSPMEGVPEARWSAWRPPAAAPHAFASDDDRSAAGTPSLSLLGNGAATPGLAAASVRRSPIEGVPEARQSAWRPPVAPAWAPLVDATATPATAVHPSPIEGVPEARWSAWRRPVAPTLALLDSPVAGTPLRPPHTSPEPVTAAIVLLSPVEGVPEARRSAWRPSLPAVTLPPVFALARASDVAPRAAAREGTPPQLLHQDTTDASAEAALAFDSPGAENSEAPPSPASAWRLEAAGFYVECLAFFAPVIVLHNIVPLKAGGVHAMVDLSDSTRVRDMGHEHRVCCSHEEAACMVDDSPERHSEPERAEANSAASQPPTATPCAAAGSAESERRSATPLSSAGIACAAAALGWAQDAEGVRDHATCQLDAVDAEPAALQDGTNRQQPRGQPAAKPRARKAAARPQNAHLRSEFSQRKSLANAGLTEMEGRRASTRARSKPLRWWCNEKKNYKRTHKSLPTVDALQLMPSTPQPPAKRQAVLKGKMVAAS